ncbi:MAG: hypothetical protein NVV68_03705 [Dokdonella sp.]|nr:hypothetical protein [Dokdonella sp.]
MNNPHFRASERQPEDDRLVLFQIPFVTAPTFGRFRNGTLYDQRGEEVDMHPSLEWWDANREIANDAPFPLHDQIDTGSRIREQLAGGLRRFKWRFTTGISNVTWRPNGQTPWRFDQIVKSAANFGQCFQFNSLRR